MTPSVRGREKLAVGGLLLLSGVATGALVGFAAGVAWSAARLPGGPALAAAVVVAAVVADVVHRRTGRLRPAAVGRQVPAAWSAVFAPPTVAVLYGARLGVGPLTILPTWLWWAALVAAASTGPWGGALAGAAFAAARLAATLVAAERVRGAMAARMARLRSAEPAGRRICAAAALALAAAGALA